MNPRTMAGAVAHFVMEAMFAARDDGDALMIGLESVVPVDGGLEVVVAGQRVEVTVRPAQPGYYAAGVLGGTCEGCGKPFRERDVVAFRMDGGVGVPEVCEDCAEGEARP